MIRGFMKTSSRTALAFAAAGLLMSTYAPAKAADLGGGCCADLEERVAELEATTARKGNRVVSLQVYGQVNKGLLIWDNGIDSDAYVVDNALASSRLGFVGKATIKPGWTAGYNIEFEINDSRSDKVNENKNGDHPELNPTSEPNDYTVNTFYLRQNHWYLESDRLGRITVGHASTSADGAYEVVLSNSLRTADPMIGNGFTVRRTDGTTTAPATTMGQWAADFDGPRYDVVRYDSPSIYGFILTASWGENDFADVALRFKREFADLRFAAAIAYQWDSTGGVNGTADRFETFGGSLSVMHVPTGLYVAFASAQKDFKGGGTGSVFTGRFDTASYWYLQGGLERKWLPYGATTVYGEYAVYSDVLEKHSEATRWGLGLNQKLDGAAMDIYAHAQFWSFDDTLGANAYGSYEDLSTVLVGSRIQF